MKNLFLVLLSLALHRSAAAIPAHLFSSCSGQAAYQNDDPFADSLSKLMSLLLRETPAIGFGLGSAGQGESKAYGLAMCRGDVSSSACAACVHRANDRVLRHCNFKKNATIWLDQCMVRYADSKFFGEIDGSRRICARGERIEPEMTVFGKEEGGLMERLVKRAYLSPLLFATGDVEVGGEGRLFGLVQCTRDLSGGDCRRCLRAAVAELPSCGHGGRRGRVMGGSCNARYEMYPFYDSS